MASPPSASQSPRGTPLDKFPEPELGTKLIPKERYTSREFAEREWEAMWTRTWLYAGPAADLQKVGDYFTCEIGRESIIVTRAAEDRIEAFYNACQHRGSRVVIERGCGHTRRFTCPYHLWTYDLDGKLLHVPDRADFPQGIPADMAIPKLRADSWNGLVFVNMDPEAESLADYLGVVAEHLDVYHWDRNFYLAEDVTFEWACNWKVGVDAFNEGYHIQGIHPELLDFTDDVDLPIDLFEKHSRFLFHVLRPSPRWTDELAQSRGYKDRWEIPDSVRGFIKQMGVHPDSVEGGMRNLRSLMMEQSRKLAVQANWDFDDLNDEQLWLDVHYTFFPNLTFNISANHFWLFRHRPHPDDPNKMYWDFQEWQRLARDAEPPPRPKHEHVAWGTARDRQLHLALQQDGDSAPPIQAGMRSRGFRGLHLAHQERRIRHWHSVLEGYLDRHAGGH